jgi:hypothetical protein
MKRSSLVLAGGVLVLGFFLVGSVLAVRLAVVPTLTRSAVASGDPGSLAVDVAGLPGSVRPLGPGETVTLDLGTVRSLETSGSWRVTLVPGAPGHATLRAPQASSFALRVSGGPDALHFELSDRSDFPGTWSGGGQAVLEISAPDLKKVAASGTSAFALEGLKTDRFEVDLSGASSVSGSGTVGYLVLALSGASSVDLDRVQAQTARIEGSGAGAVTVHSAGGTVEGELSGAVNLRVTGTPSSVRVDTSGMAAVTRS